MAFRHKKIPIDQNHASHSYEYANRAERIAKVSADFDTQELNRIALQLDTNSLQRLSQITPVVQWSPIAGSVMFHQLQSDQVLDIVYNEAGLITRTDYSSGYYCIVLYNEADKVSTVTYYKTATNLVVEQWTYTYDAEDRLKTSTQTV